MGSHGHYYEFRLSYLSKSFDHDTDRDNQTIFEVVTVRYLHTDKILAVK
jgi:hypothetical protein